MLLFLFGSIAHCLPAYLPVRLGELSPVDASSVVGRLSLLPLASCPLAWRLPRTRPGNRSSSSQARNGVRLAQFNQRILASPRFASSRRPPFTHNLASLLIPSLQ